MPDRIALLERLADHADVQAIRDALTRFCRAMDRCDVALAKSVFHEDAHEDHGPVVGNAHELLDTMIPMLKTSYERLVRNIGNLSVEVAGDSALSEANWSGIMRDSVNDMFHQGRYLDRWERRAGEWKIAARVSLIDWWRLEVRNANPFMANAEAMFKFAGRGFEDLEVRAALGLSERN
jgi:ketosteroid isomerase-like protein